MATIRLPNDFKEFLRLLDEHQVEYLLIGGYAVAYYGYPRNTGDMDIWISRTQENSERLARVLIAFGFSPNSIDASTFVQPDMIFRMGVPPIRIEVHTSISGVNFEEAYPLRHKSTIDGVIVDLIDLQRLKRNKKAAGRTKDLNDLENL